MPLASSYMLRCLILPLIAVLLPCLAGCGSGTYEPKFDQALRAGKGAAVFVVLGKKPLTIGDTPVSIRLPKDLGGTIYDKNSHSPDDPKSAPHPIRLKPNFLSKLPGWVYTIEKRAKDEKNTEYPISCAIFAIDANEFKGKIDMAKVIRDTIKAQYPKEDFVKEECTAPDGSSISWDLLKGSGKQEFLVKVEGAEQTSRQEDVGQVQFWLHQSPQYIVLLAWRVPKPIEGSFKLDELAKLAASTLVVGEPAAK